MKNLSFFAAGFLYCAALFAQTTDTVLPVEPSSLAEPVSSTEQAAVSESSSNERERLFKLSLLWSGSWEEFSQDGGTLHNRTEIKLDFLKSGFTLRGQILDRRPLKLDFEQPWGDPEKTVTNFNGALYHKPTGSRLLFGVIDEWGLPARIRNPWIRSPPYAENHKPIIADLRTSVSSTKNDEAYLYLSSPFFNLFPSARFRGFVSAQTEIESFKPALSGGMEFSFPNKTSLLLETFYTAATLPPSKSSTWFSSSPPLPEREFRLYAAGLIFSNPLISLSSDFAMSETFAWGTDIYGNLGITLTPAFSFGGVKRPLSVSLAADGAGERFIYRDGANHGEGFRSAAKIEWKRRYNSLLRLNTVLRGHSFGEDFRRSSTGFYYRFPNKSSNGVVYPIRLTRISLTADRNADNPQKISDGLSGYIGFSINLQQFSIKSPLGLNLSGSIKGLSASEMPSPYPVPQTSWDFDTAKMGCEFTWSPHIFQFRSKIGYSINDKNTEKWDFSLSASARFRQGRLSFKVATADFPENWKWTVSWRLQND